jgi:aldehyde dehydrogenase (NAD+)/betaine-aldehyde dehydrogenase
VSTTLTAVDPATREPFAELVAADAAAVDAAVRRARGAFRAERDWRVPATRVAVLNRLAALVAEQAEALAELECRDTGKPLAQARADAAVTVRYFAFYAAAADKLDGRAIPLGPGFVDYTVLEPRGVCGQIIPWNYPLQVAARCAGPALAAGNAVILKPSELASQTPVRLAELALEAGLPEGLLQVLPGAGETGAALVAHPGVDHVTFVGSPATGARVAHACAERLAPVELELGGKSPNVVFADADLDRVVPAVVKALVQNAGQSCSAGTRLLVERSRYDEVLDAVAAAFEGLTIGPGLEDPDLGPLISAGQQAHALGMLERARAQGVDVRTGGRAPAAHADGWYLEPTLVCNVDPGSELFNEEVFGPVLVAAPFADEEEAIALANGTPYGLVAGVWTNDLARAHRVAAEIEAGQVFVNSYGVAGGVELPFGGVKRSGYGRGKGMEALHAYTQVKNVCVSL